jgi:hypothetical protein
VLGANDGIISTASLIVGVAVVAIGGLIAGTFLTLLIVNLNKEDCLAHQSNHRLFSPLGRADSRSVRPCHRAVERGCEVATRAITTPHSR